MAAKHYIIFIPGLADHTWRRLGQNALFGLWRYRYGVMAHYFDVYWAEPHGDFDARLNRLLERIDAAHKQGSVVSLVAPSAGSSLALHAFAKRQNVLHAVVTVCGTFGPLRHVAPAIQKANPAYTEAMRRLPAAIAALTPASKARLLSVKPISDRVVPPNDMTIPGIQYLQLSTRGHTWTIFMAITVYSRKLVAFIKRI